MAARTITLADDPAAALERLTTVLQAGEVVLLPTDTVYGIAALPGDRSATDRLFALKGRRGDVPIAVLCASAQQALALAAADVDPAVATVAARWWPGPLTLVVPRGAGVRLHLGEPVSTVGLRVPDHDLVRALAAEVGPLAVTSANRHGAPTPATASAAASQLVGEVALVVDGGELAGTASTVVDVTERPWQVRRSGPLPVEEILAAGDQRPTRY